MLQPCTSVLLYTRNTCDLCAEDKSLWVNTALWSHQAVSYILSLSLSLYRRIIIIIRQMANHKFVRVAAPLGVCLSALLSLLSLFIAQNLTKACALALTTLF